LVSVKVALETMWVSFGEFAVVRELLRVRRPGMGFWRVFKKERVWVSVGKRYSGMLDTCCSEHLLETVQV
jgi:hypothetical protein